MYTSIITIVLLVIPMLAHAQFLTNQPNFGPATQIAAGTSLVVSILISVVAAAALLFFFWGLAKYILNAGEAEKEEGRKIMIRGIIALFVIAAIWGIVAFISNTLGIGTGGFLQAPGVIPGGSGGGGASGGGQICIQILGGNFCFGGSF